MMTIHQQEKRADKSTKRTSSRTSSSTTSSNGGPSAIAQETAADTANAAVRREPVGPAQTANAQPAVAPIAVAGITNGKAGAKRAAGEKSTARASSTRETKSSSTGEPTQNMVWQVVLLPVTQIDPNPLQPRVAFNAGEMADLISSVRTHGVLQPVTVRTTKPVNRPEEHNNTIPHAPVKNGHGSKVVRYHLVSGERRLRACKEASRKVIPAIIRDDLSDAAAAELALVENLQRSNLNPVEEAAGYKRLMLEFRMKVRHEAQ